MRIKNKQKKARFLCCSQIDSILIWRQYGYWQEGGEPPEWFTLKEYSDELDYLLSELKEPDLQIDIEVKEYAPGLWQANWKLYDKNNLHINSDTGGVTCCKSEQRAYDYTTERYHRLKYLYDGDVEALLVYKRTGIACLPDWNTNKTDSYGYKDGKKNLVPRVSEVNK